MVPAPGTLRPPAFFVDGPEGGRWQFTRHNESVHYSKVSQKFDSFFLLSWRDLSPLTSQRWLMTFPAANNFSHFRPPPKISPKVFRLSASTSLSPPQTRLSNGVSSRRERSLLFPGMESAKNNIFVADSAHTWWKVAECKPRPIKVTLFKVAAI